MTTKSVRDRFQIEMNAKSDGSYLTFVNEEIDEFISFGIRQFYARRLSGFTPDRTSFEQWQKRSDDLKCVYTQHNCELFATGTKNGSKWKSFIIPSDYQHMLSEDASVVSITNNVPTEIGLFDVYECTTDNFTARLNDSLGPHIYDKKKVRPLRLYQFTRPIDPIYGPAYLAIDSDGSNLNLLDVDSTSSAYLNVTNEDDKPFMYSTLYYKSPENIDVNKYTIEYIRIPNMFGMYSEEYAASVAGLVGYEFDETRNITQVPDYAWDEVLSIAIKHALENSSSYRIQTYQQEKLEIQ